MSDLSSALKGPAPTREYLTALTELPISELDKAKERHQQEGSLTPELDTFFNVVEREKANDILARWSAPEVDENSVIYDAEQLFRSGQLPARYEPLINQVVREKIKDSKQVGILDTAGRIIKALPGAAPEAATQMFQSAVENVQTALGETPKSLAGLAFAKLSGDKELERAALELGMRAGARTASGMEAETRESAGFLSRGLPRLYDFVGSMLSKGQVQVGPMLALTAATEARKAFSGAGEAAQLSAKREAALTDDKALAEFVGTRRQQEAKIQEAREFKGAAAKLIGADIESLKAAGVELKPEDYDRAQKAGVLLDLTEPAFVPFALGASVTGRSLRKMTSSVLSELGAGKLAAAVAEKAPSVAPRTVALGRLVKTAEQVADEARQYDTVLRKIRVASGNALVKTGEKIQQIPLPVGSPLLVAGGVLASGGDVNTAGVAAVTAAGARYLLGSRLGVKAAGKIAKGAGEVLRYTPGIDSPWEAVRRASIDLRRDMVRAAGAGVAEGSLYALDPAASPEAKAAIISSGLTMAPAGALTARAGDWAKHGMLFSPRLGRPDSISGLPAAPRSYGTESDAFNLSNFNKLSEDSTIFLRSLQDLMGDNGGLYVATTPQEFQTLVAQRTRQTPGQPPLLVPEGVQGMALKPHQTTSGKAEAIINLSNSVNESAGHEVTHALLYALEASGPEGAAKVQAIRDQAYKSLGGPSSSRFQQVKTKYAEALGQQIGDDVAIDEWIAEHGSVVLAGLPVGKLGADKGVVKGLYDALFTLAEALELRVPGYQQGATGPVTSQTLKYSPSVSLLNALDNLFYAYKLENDAAVPAPEAAVGVPPVIAPEGVQNVEVVTPPAPVAGFKKGDPIGNITNPQGELVFSGVKVWADSQGPTVRIEGVDTNGNIVRADVPRAWLESKAGTAVPPVDVGATVPVPATLTEQPAVPAPGSISGIPPKAPTAPKPAPQAPANVRVTEAQRQAVVQPTPEQVAQNTRRLTEMAQRGRTDQGYVQVEYLSAVADEKPADAQKRLEQRRLADAAEVSTPDYQNPLRQVYEKVFAPYKPGFTANTVFGFSFDKLVQNLDILAGWLSENPDVKIPYASPTDPQIRADLRTYLTNSSNGYGGDGTRLVRPPDTLPGTVTPENPNYRPVALPRERAQFINLLMGLEPAQKMTAGEAYNYRFAKLNGLEPSLTAKGGPEVNPLRAQLKAAGFDSKLLNSVLENLRIDRIGANVVERPDIDLPVVEGAIVRAGFMPAAAKQEGRRELVNVGLKIGDKISLTKEDVIKAFADEGITLENVQVRESGTEPTVIAAVRGADKAAIDRASNTLQQDAIAVYNPADDSGYLAGPRPENFGGKFLKEYFLMPEQTPADFMPSKLKQQSEVWAEMRAWRDTSTKFSPEDANKVVISEEVLSKDGTLMIAARFDGRLIGNVLIDPNYRTSRWGWLDIEVAKPWRRLGIGERLYNTALNAAEKAGKRFTMSSKSADGKKFFPVVEARREDRGVAMMPKPLKGSLGNGDIKFFHYSDTPNKGAIDPKFFGKSGVTGAREQAGLPRAYAYAEGSTLGQDAGLVDARKHYYEGSVPKGQIYDGVEDVLGYGDMANRAKADQMLIDKGFVGIYREGLNGVKQLEFFQPMEVTEAEKPATTGPLAEEATPILPPLALEEIDYAAQDREFARKKAAGEPLYMPEGDEMREYSVEFKVQHPSWDTPKGWNKHEIVMARSRREAIDSVKQQIYDNQFGQGMVWIRATETAPASSPTRSTQETKAVSKLGLGAFGIFTKQVDGKTVYYASPGFKDVEGSLQELARLLYSDNIPPELQNLIDEVNKGSEGAFMPKATEAQEAAFKDSKVRNEDGSLKPMFHFTTADFNRFGRGDLGYHFGTAEQAFDRGVANEALRVWGDTETPSAREGSRTIPVYLDIKNPLRMMDVGTWHDPVEVFDNIPSWLLKKEAMRSAHAESGKYQSWMNDWTGPIEKFNDAARVASKPFMDAIREGIKALGYDGIIYRNAFESREQDGDSYIAFDNDQIMPAFTKDVGARWMPEIDGAKIQPLDADVAAAFMPAPRVNLEDYIGRDVVTLTTDRLDVGFKDVGPTGAKKPTRKQAQGGRGFPLLYTGLGWAFSDPGSAKRFLTRLQATADGDTALVATAVLGEHNVLNSPFGQHAVAMAYRHAVDSGVLKLKDVDRSIRTIFSRAAASTLGDPDMKKIKTLEDYERASENWPFSFGATRELAKRLDAAELKIPAELRQAVGLDALSLARSISDPELAGLPNFTLVSLMEIPVDQTPVKDDIHFSYPYTVKGKLLGFLKDPIAADNLISSPRVRKGGQLTAQPMMTVMPSLDLLKPTELNPEPQQVLAEARLEYAKP